MNVADPNTETEIVSLGSWQSAIWPPKSPAPPPTDRVMLASALQEVEEQMSALGLLQRRLSG